MRCRAIGRRIILRVGSFASVETKRLRERLQALDQAISQLPDVEREVLAMRLQGDLPFKEIAKIIGAPIGTVLARMHSAKKRLKPLLEGKLNE